MTVSTRSVAVVPLGSSPVRRKPTTGGTSIESRLAEHRCLGLYPADTPPEHAETVHHRRVRVGADEGVGNGLPVVGVAKTTRARYSRFTWWQMPVPGGTTRKSSNASCAHSQQLVALDVALVLDVDVGGERRGETRGLGDDRVVDHELHRYQRVDPVGVSAQRAERVAHRRKVHDRRDAGEVLHEDALGGEADLAPCWRAPACCARPAASASTSVNVAPSS